MKKCLVVAVSVVFLVSIAFVSSPVKAGEENSLKKDLKIEFVKSELWTKGVKQANKGSDSLSAPKKDNTLYFPEELEFALRLIAD